MPGKEVTHTTDEVYGISRDLPLNYVPRDTVDEVLIENLTRDKHLVIYGSSKQGKTSLRKHCLKDTDYIVVQCSNRWDLAGLHEAILKTAGFQLTQSTTKTTSGKAKLLAGISGKLFGTGASASTEVEGNHSRQIVQSQLELDASDVNDVIRALSSIQFNKYIVLEDFHYLQLETQKDFSVALKAFHETSRLCFIVVGVWLEENRLSVYNGDLAGRVVPIDADRWTPNELVNVIDEGARLLKVEFPESTKSAILRESYSSVYIVQEACRRICRAEHVYDTQTTTRVIGANSDVPAVISAIVAEQSARYNAFIRLFSDGFQDSNLKMYRWLLLPVLTAHSTELQRGLTYAHIRKLIQKHHPSGDSLNAGNLTQALQSVAALQAKKDVKPIVLDYDETNRRLSVVDRGLFVWLAQQQRAELLDMAGFDASVIGKLGSTSLPLPPN